MLGEIIVEAAGGLVRLMGRLLGEIFLHLIFEILVQGVGYLLCKPFYRNVRPDSALTTVTGIAFWFVVAVAVFLTYENFMAVEPG